MKIETIEFKTNTKELDISFPCYKAMHRKYTFAKFEIIEHYIVVTIAQHGFSTQTLIKQEKFFINKDVVDRDFEHLLNEYEHECTLEEYQLHFDKTLKLLM